MHPRRGFVRFRKRPRDLAQVAGPFGQLSPREIKMAPSRKGGGGGEGGGGEVRRVHAGRARGSNPQFQLNKCIINYGPQQ
jgi:hypothetical protein